jgi:DNA-binding MarR family transcriptional regulator
MAAEDALDLSDGLFQLSFALQAALAEIAADHELSMIQVRMLGILRDHEPGVLELARLLGLEKSTVSELVKRAEARGLVERVPSTDDRRAATIRVTAHGRTLVRPIEAAARAAVEALVAPLSEAERKRLTALVWRVVGAVGE